MKDLAWMRLLALLLDKEGSGTGEGNTTVEDDDDDEGPDVPGDLAKQLKEWQAYAKRLRTKEAAKRVENRDLKAKLDAINADLAKAKKDHEAELERVRNEEKVKYDALSADQKKQQDARTVEQEIRAQATKAGAKDVDDLLKLIDKSTISLDDKGNVVGADKVIEEFKKAKPHLFGSASSSSSSQQTPPPNTGEVKKATDMTPEEYAAAKSKFTGSPQLRRYG